MSPRKKNNLLHSTKHVGSSRIDNLAEKTNCHSDSADPCEGSRLRARKGVQASDFAGLGNDVVPAIIDHGSFVKQYHL